MLAKKRLLLQVLFICLLPFLIMQTVYAVPGQYKRVRLPYASGVTRLVTGTHNRAGGRHALDFGMYKEEVLAMYGGRVTFRGWSDYYTGNMLIIDHGDNYCSIYMHLETFYVNLGDLVWQGRPVAKSGNTGHTGTGGALPYHLHVSVTQKNSNGTCSTAHANEIAMIFDEVPNRELVYNDNVTSQNVKRNTNTGRVAFPSNPLPVSTLYQDQNYGRLNLRVCANNLPGKTVFVIASRPGREWFYSQQATTTCITFWDMDGAGPLLSGTTYTTRVALQSWPERTWPVPCYSATNGYGLCDSLRRP